MTLLVKDANTTTQPLSTGLDSSGNLVPMHAPASIISGVATPVSVAAPLPVINTAGSAAIDGSGTISSGGTAQTLFGGVVPVDGWLVANNSSTTLYVSDVGTATSGGASIPIAAGWSSRRPRDTSRPDQSAFTGRLRVKRSQRVGGNGRWRCVLLTREGNNGPLARAIMIFNHRRPSARWWRSYPRPRRERPPQASQRTGATGGEAFFPGVYPCSRTLVCIVEFRAVAWQFFHAVDHRRCNSGRRCSGLFGTTLDRRALQWRDRRRYPR